MTAVYSFFFSFFLRIVFISGLECPPKKFIGTLGHQERQTDKREAQRKKDDHRRLSRSADY